MSKLHDALQRVTEDRQRQSGPVSPAPVMAPAHSVVSRHDNGGLWRIGYGLTAALLVVAVAGSLLVNFKTMAELENSKDMTLVLSRHMDDQKKELAAIRQYWAKAESARKDQREQIIALQKNVRNLGKNLEEAKSNLAKIEDLKVNDKLMLEKFIALSEKVKELSKIKTVNGE